MYLRFILHISIILWKKYNTITIYRLLFYFPSIVSYFRILTNIFVSIARKRRKGRKANTNEIEITVNRRRIRFSNFPERKQLQSPFVRNHRHDWQLIFSVEIANDSIGPIPSIAQTTRSINSNPPQDQFTPYFVPPPLPPWNEVENRRGEPVRWQAPLKNLANLPSPSLLRRLNFRVEMISTMAEDLRTLTFFLSHPYTTFDQIYLAYKPLWNDVAAILIVTRQPLLLGWGAGAVVCTPNWYSYFL